jgi:hypothetical protein
MLTTVIIYPYFERLRESTDISPEFTIDFKLALLKR